MAAVLGNAVELAEGQLFLPASITRNPQGLFLVPATTLAEGSFSQFVARVFAAGARFSGLDYPLFLDLLYALQDTPATTTVKLADDIVPFPAERRMFYRGLKIAPDKKSAEYLFETIHVTPDEADAVEVAVTLDTDEFIAALWEQGVRFGIDMVRVREALENPQMQRLVVARELPPTPGQDATIAERTQALHRSNAPKIRPDGRMDLSQFQNRFPQIDAGVPLLQKIPRCLGKPGYTVTGARLEPDLPKDFELAPLAGPGTRIENSGEGELVISTRDGFINIDSQTGQISISDKIVSREGVSMKSTGDVSLTGDEFEEHGEVQERRIVEGMHMTFFSTVYGKIISRGGRVEFKEGLIGGQATSPGGSISIKGRASRATVEACGGEIVIEQAEGCLIVGSRIKIERAIQCDILGEQIIVGLSEGSAIAGKQVRIGESTTRKDNESIIAILVPDMARHDHEVAENDEARQQALQTLAKIEAESAAMLAETGFRNYLTLAATIAKGGAKLTDAHEARWQQTRERFSPQARQWQTLQQAQTAAKRRLADLEAERTALVNEKARRESGIGCVIAAINGDTLVRRMRFHGDQSIDGGAQARALTAQLRELGSQDDRLFWARSGEFSWRADTTGEDGADQG